MGATRQLDSGGFPEHGFQLVWSVGLRQICQGGMYWVPSCFLTLEASQTQGRRGGCGGRGSRTWIWSSPGGGSVCPAVHTWSGESAPVLTLGCRREGEETSDCRELSPLSPHLYTQQNTETKTKSLSGWGPALGLRLPPGHIFLQTLRRAQQTFSVKILLPWLCPSCGSRREARDVNVPHFCVLAKPYVWTLNFPFHAFT